MNVHPENNWLKHNGRMSAPCFDELKDLRRKINLHTAPEVGIIGLMRFRWPSFHVLLPEG